MSNIKKMMPNKLQQIARDMYPKYDRNFRFTQFLRYVKIGDPNECWEWQGDCGESYPGWRWAEKHISNAHVASYVFFGGKIPKRHGKKKLCVCHNCPGGDNPRCVNPNHLWLGTKNQNNQDMCNKGRH